MTELLDPIVLNLVYAGLGGLMMLIGGWLSYQLFSHTMGFDVEKELKAGNVAVGLVMLGIFLAVGIGMGLVIGLTLH